MIHHILQNIIDSFRVNPRELTDHEKHDFNNLLVEMAKANKRCDEMVFDPEYPKIGDDIHFSVADANDKVALSLVAKLTLKKCIFTVAGTKHWRFKPEYEHYLASHNWNVEYGDQESFQDKLLLRQDAKKYSENFTVNLLPTIRKLSTQLCIAA